jgi:hypothetical protein
MTFGFQIIRVATTPGTSGKLQSKSQRKPGEVQPRPALYNLFSGRPATALIATHLACIFSLITS